jgi:hypothetical protein
MAPMSPLNSSVFLSVFTSAGHGIDADRAVPCYLQWSNTDTGSKYKLINRLLREVAPILFCVDVAQRWRQKNLEIFLSHLTDDELICEFWIGYVNELYNDAKATLHTSASGVLRKSNDFILQMV